jgi:hypothetical protein
VIGKLILSKLTRFVFRGLTLICLVGFATFYGVASTEFGFFPANFVTSSLHKLKAWKDHNIDVSQYPTDAIPKLEVSAGPRFRFSPDQTPLNPEEAVLMTGGLYQHLDACPELGCFAWVVDQQGNLLHAWPFTELTRNGINVVQAGSKILTAIDAHLSPDGELFVQFSFIGAGYDGLLAKFGRDGKLLWSRRGNTHHWFDVEDSGSVLSLGFVKGRSLLELPKWKVTDRCRRGEHAIIDTIIEIGPDAKIVKEVDLVGVFVASDYSGLLPLSTTPCDPFHMTSISSLPKTLNTAYPALTAGDMLLSALSLNSIAIVDRASYRIKWIETGLTNLHYSPRFVGNNKIMAIEFAPGNAEISVARLVTINLATRKLAQVFPRPEPGSGKSETFHPGIFGAQRISLNADMTHVLVTNAKLGKVFAIDLDRGTVAWEYANNQMVVDAWKERMGEDQRNFLRFALRSAHFVPRRYVPAVGQRARD